MNVNGLGGPERAMQQRSGALTSPKGVKDGRQAKEDKTALTMDDFFKLIAVQLQNQDMTNPMSNSEMMDQLVQMATVEAMASMTTQVGNSYATGLLGQQVDILYADGKTMVHDSGKVTGINMSTYPLTVYLDDKKEGYPMSSIAFIGQNKLADGEEPGETEEPGEPEGPGTAPDKPEDGTAAQDKPGAPVKPQKPEGAGEAGALGGPGVKKAIQNNRL